MNAMLLTALPSASSCSTNIATDAALPTRGLLVTLAGIALGKTGERRSTPPVRLLTTSLAFDFIDIARRGEWIEAQCDFQRTGREIAFANCYVKRASGVIGRASGVFKVLSLR